MATPANKPTPAPSAPPIGGAGVGKSGVTIVTIPEKYYGVALRLNALTEAEAMKPPPPPPPAPTRVVQMAVMPQRRSILPVVLLIIALIAVVAGGFVYFNRDLLFKKPAPSVPPPVVSPTPPAAPSQLSGLVGTASVSLNWVDGAGNEDGFRVERREAAGTFVALTTLPANSSAFLDVSVLPDRQYAYRVFAMNQGGESGPSNEATVTIPAAVPVPPAAPTLPPSGLDSDSDGLTDVEEQFYGTDPHNPDTDADGYLDGNELYHLYNPLAVAPVRLLDSGVVSNFSSPAGWSIYVPVKWTTTFDAQDGSQATIDSKHGETFVIKLEDNASRLSLKDWYLAQHPGTDLTTLRVFTTKGGLNGILGVDRLDAYFLWDSKIFSIRYDMDGQTFVNFRTTFEMMLNSLKLNGAPVVAAPAESTSGPGTIVGANVPVAAPTSTELTPTATSTVPTASSTESMTTSTAATSTP